MYNFSELVNKLAVRSSQESLEQLQLVAEDYFDYNTSVEERFIEWKRDAKKSASFHICHEIYNKSEKHIAEMILVVFKGEKLEKKLTALRQLGYTAKYVKCF